MISDPLTGTVQIDARGLPEPIIGATFQAPHYPTESFTITAITAHPILRHDPTGRPYTHTIAFTSTRPNPTFSEITIPLPMTTYATPPSLAIATPYPRIGTCGEPVDLIRLTLERPRAIPDLLVGFDGERNGWVIGASFRTPDGDDFTFRELHFIPEDTMDEDAPPTRV